mgnify:FL=1
MIFVCEVIVATSLIVRLGKEKFESSKRQKVNFFSESSPDHSLVNDLLNDLKNYPHAYVTACLMDRQIRAERAWTIPYEIKKSACTFKINDLKDITLSEYKKIFNKNKLHRFNDTMADIFHRAILDIWNKYEGDASLIWKNKPGSATVVYRFLEFKGGGVKIATMAANILARDFKIPFSDYCSIDVSPDVHVVRVMKRMGLVDKSGNIDMVIYKARELNPEFPGIIDLVCWEVGTQFCRPTKPDCMNCIVSSECLKLL